MGRYLVRLNDGGRAHYLEWSTVVDAPVSATMTRGQLIRWHTVQYGKRSPLAERMQRLDAQGTSALFDNSTEDTVWLNRAGPGESMLSMRGLVLGYVRGWPDERLRPFIVPKLDAPDINSDYNDLYKRWAEHDNRRRAACGRWP